MPWIMAGHSSCTFHEHPKYRQHVLIVMTKGHSQASICKRTFRVLQLSQYSVTAKKVIKVRKRKMTVVGNC